MLRVFVRRKARSERGDLEQHAARLAEVDRAEPEAVDDRRRPAAGLDDALPPRLVVLHRRCKRDVVDGAGARAAGLVRRVLVLDPAAARLAARLPGLSRALEAERLEERLGAQLRVPRVRADALEPLQRELLR